MDELLLIVERVGRVVILRRENQDLKAVLEDKFSFSGILGANSQMRAVLEKIKMVAATDSTSLILGESGTGKELVANAIHQNSPRSQYPLIKVSCAAFRKPSWKRNSSAMRRGRLRGRCDSGVGGLSWHIEGRCFSMKSGKSRRSSRSNCCVYLQERTV